MNKFTRFGKQLRTVATLFVSVLVAQAAWAIPVESVAPVEVTFGGSSRLEVYRDEAQSAYETPHWQKDRAFQSPVCYRRNTKVTVSAKLSVLPVEATGEIRVRGYSNDHDFVEQTLTPSGGFVYYGSTESDEYIPNNIRPGDSFSIRWEFYNEETENWELAGWTGNRLYAVLGTPTQTLYESVVHYACQPNGGRTLVDEAAIVSGTWGKFSGRNAIRQEDGLELTYWNPMGGHVSATQTDELLKNGKGQCGSWARFFQSSLAANSISSTFLYLTPIYTHDNFPSLIDPRGFMHVKNWEFSSTLSPPRTDTTTLRNFTHRVASDRSGIAGQNNSDPPSVFANHFIIQHDSNYYDPSYGGAPFSSAGTDAGKAAWEDSSIAGFSKFFTTYSGLELIGVDEYFKENESGAGNVETTFTAL